MADTVIFSFTYRHFHCILLTIKIKEIIYHENRCYHTCRFQKQEYQMCIRDSSYIIKKSKIPDRISPKSFHSSLRWHYPNQVPGSKGTPSSQPFCKLPYISYNQILLFVFQYSIIICPFQGNFSVGKFFGLSQ